MGTSNIHCMVVDSVVGLKQVHHVQQSELVLVEESQSWREPERRYTAGARVLG